MLGYQYYQSYKLNIIRTRAFNHTGPRRGEVFVTSNFARQLAEIRKGKRAPIMKVGNLEAKRDFSDVRDVVKAMILLVDSKISGERFILSAENLSYRELFEMIAEELGKSPPAYKASKWMGEVAWRIEHIKGKLTGTKPLITKETANTAVNIYRYSNHKITGQLDFQFIPIQQTIKEACEYYLNNLVNIND